MTESQIAAMALKAMNANNITVLVTLISEATDHLSKIAHERHIPIDTFLKSHPVIQMLSYKLKNLVVLNPDTTSYHRTILQCRTIMESPNELPRLSANSR